MNLQKWMLSAAFIVVLSGCGNSKEVDSNQQDTYSSSAPTVQSSTDAASTETDDVAANSGNASELSTKEKEDIRLYLQQYYAGINYIGQEMSKAGDVENLPSDATNEEIIAYFQTHNNNINDQLQKLQSMKFPQINNEDIRTEVESIRDRGWYFASTGRDVVSKSIEYMQSDDESLYEQTQELVNEMATTLALLQKQMEQLNLKLQ
ncbi:hypothetical protein [Paenibacillus sp. WLX2291]|uniref:hypothetical protein n=1 Tax=Paenibacillus sp. WLX2291 TaxID=3296934 RepID=UPI003983E195